MSDRVQFRRGNAVVSFVQPFYGGRKIIANAPLSSNSFDDLIAALHDAKDAYADPTTQEGHQ